MHHTATPPTAAHRPTRLSPRTAVTVLMLAAAICAAAYAAGKNTLRDRWTANLKEYAQHTSHEKYFLEEIEKINKSNTDSAAPAQLAASYYPMCRKFTDRGEYIAEILFARYMLSELRKTASRPADFLIMAKYANSAGIGYTALRFYDEARDMFDKGTAISVKYGFRDVLAQIYTNHARLYYDTGKYTEALNMLNKLKRLTGGDGILYNNMALVYLNLHLTDKAMSCLDSALRCSGGNDGQKARILINKGSTLIETRNYERAAACLAEAGRLITDSTSPVTALMLHLNLAQLDIEKGNTRKAVKEMEYIEKEVMPRQSDVIKGMVMKDIVGLYIRLDSYAEASKYLQKNIRLNDSLNYDNQKRQLTQLMTLYDMAQLRNDNIQLKNENEMARISLRNRTIIAAATVLVAVLLSVLVVVVIRKRQNEQRQNAVIREQEQMLYALRQKEYEREKTQMENEINRKSRELTLFSIDLSSIDNLHKNICDELAGLASDTAEEDTRKRINAVSLKLRRQTAHSLSEGFKKYFSEVSPQFNSRLKEAHPNLTPNDQRLCAYIYMGLTSKEISQITFKEVESVEKSRNRLRKKISLDSSIPIREYLSSIIDSGGNINAAG